MTAAGGAVPVVVTARDGQVLHGGWWLPAEAGPDTPAIVLCHGAGASWHDSVPAWLGPALAGHGFPALALNRHDSGDYGRQDVEQQSCLDDIGLAVEEAFQRGYRRIVLVGHSLGTVFSTAWLARTGDPRVLGLALLGAVHDAEISARTVVQAGVFDRNLAEARRLWSEGLADQVHPFASSMGRPLPRTPRSWLSWWHPLNALRPRHDVRHVTVPILLLRQDTDQATPHAMSQAILEEGILAGRPIQYQVIPDPAGRSALDGHRFAGHEEEAATALASWIRAICPA